MSENKLVEKTKEVFNKQKELTDLIDELKEEVKGVYYQNRRLSDENKSLKKQVSLLQSKQGEVKEPIGFEPSFSLPKEEKVEVVEAKPTMEQPTELPLEHPAERPEPIEEKDYYNYEIERNTRKNAISEFFLGKNVIAKIAAILIFLGVLTFGQMAYVDFLNDVGRAFLILFTGLVFCGVAFLTEKRNYTVFSNVFYGVGLFIIFYSILLAGFQFALFNSVWISILLLALLLATMVYFKDKRNDFLDSILFTFSNVIGFAFLFCLSDLSIAISVVFSILFVGTIGFVAYMYFMKYYRDNSLVKSIFQMIQFGGTIYYLLFILFNDELLESSPIALIAFSLLQVGILVFTNLSFEFDDKSRLPYVSPVILLITLYITANLLNITILQDRYISFTLSFLTFSILLIPLLVMVSKKFDKQLPNMSRIYTYTLGASYLIYAVTASSIFDQVLYPMGTRFLLLGIGLISSYVVLTLRQDEKLKFLYWGYTIMFVLLVITEFYILDNLRGYYLNDAIILGVVSLTLIGVNISLKYWKQLECIVEKEIMKAFMVFAFLPFIIILMKEHISSDSAYIMAVIMLWLVGNRWLSELKPLKTVYHNYYTLILNVVIVLLTFTLNQVYFDHDFSQFSDVFKLMFMFSVNVYIIYSLKEIYVDHLRKHHPETMFIVVYLLGVLVHSYYIHNYINIEFDKVILSSYFLIASAVGVLIGFRQNWSNSRRLGLFAIYFSLLKFFIYDFYTQDFTSFVRMMTYFILGFVLLGISILYAYLERTYSKQ